MKQQHGLALVLVLWILALMTLMAGSFALSTQREASLLSHARDRVRALAMAEGGIHYAMMMLSLADQQRRWRSDGTLYSWEMGGAQLRVAIFDESGKIDANGVQELTLQTFLSLATGDERAATALADAIHDWRDPDELKHLHGAEADDYRAAGLGQVPQNRQFLVVDELRGVLGMTPELFRRLEPLVTLYTSRDGVNPAKASRDMLLLLAGGNADLVDGYLAQRQFNPATPFPPVAGIQFNSTGDQVFTIRAQAEFPGQAGAAVRAVVRRGRGMDGLPFTILNWKPLPPGVPSGGQDRN